MVCAISSFASCLASWISERVPEPVIPSPWLMRRALGVVASRKLVSRFASLRHRVRRTHRVDDERAPSYRQLTSGGLVLTGFRVLERTSTSYATVPQVATTQGRKQGCSRAA